MQLIITVEVNPENSPEWIDPHHESGLTEAGFEKLMGMSGPAPLDWLGDVQDTKLVKNGSWRELEGKPDA